VHMDPVEELRAIEEIRQLKYRYLRCVDLKLGDEIGDTFTADATVDYGTMVYGQPLKISGRDHIVEFFGSKLGPDIITVHSAGQPEITVDGGAARGTWAFEDTVFATEHRIVIRAPRSTGTATNAARTAAGGSRIPGTCAPTRR
jgi:hypothetical protein